LLSRRVETIIQCLNKRFLLRVICFLLSSIYNPCPYAPDVSILFFYIILNAITLIQSQKESGSREREPKKKVLKKYNALQ
jgi:hypothetical protein